MIYQYFLIAIASKWFDWILFLFKKTFECQFITASTDDLLFFHFGFSAAFDTNSQILHYSNSEVVSEAVVTIQKIKLSCFVKIRCFNLIEEVKSKEGCYCQIFWRWLTDWKEAAFAVRRAVSCSTAQFLEALSKTSLHPLFIRNTFLVTFEASQGGRLFFHRAVREWWCFLIAAFLPFFLLQIY